MLPKAARLIVSALDLHAWPTPLLSAPAYAAALTFMGDPATYRAFRAAGVSALTPGFRLFPTAHANADQHFWWRFGHAAALAQAPAPATQSEWLMPLRARPTNLAADFDLAGLPRARAHVTVWLWPFGWASQVEMRFTGPLDAGQAAQITAALANGGMKPFKLGGQTLSLVQLFQKVGDAVEADLLAAGAKPVAQLRVPRRMVVGYVCAPGEPFRRFAAEPWPGDASPLRWSDKDRAALVSILAARPVAMSEVNQVGAPGQPYGVVSVKRGNIALTHPQHGALLMLRHATDCGWSRTPQFCLMANVRASLLTWAALGALAASPGVGANHAALVAAGEQAAKALRANYSNPVFQALSMKRAA